MKVPSGIARGLLLLAMLQTGHGEYRHKIRGPPPKPLPPRPPIPHFGSKPFPHTQHFNTKNKWPYIPTSNSAHRIIPPMRGTNLQYHHPLPQLHKPYLWNGPIQSNVRGIPLGLHSPGPQFQFKGPSLLLGTSSLPPWKLESHLNHGFRAPVLKEPFVPSPPSEYQPPKTSHPQPPAITHVGNAIDDDKGPIHTIPAPNLSPSSNPNHNHQHEALFHTSAFPQPHTKLEQPHGYEVHEPSNDQAGHTPNGVPTYFAPDPDPSLPAPKVPETTDPHSLPSNGKTPQHPLQAPVLQNLDNSGSLGNSLSTQELFQLLHTPPQHPQHQQPLVDSYGMPLMLQPQLQQHFHQQAAVFPPATFLKQEEPVQDNLVVFKTDFKPDYQTFNYEEQYQGSSHQQDKYRNAYDEQEESENVPSVTVVRKSPESTITSFQEQFEHQKTHEAKLNSVTEEDIYYDNTATNPDNENTQEDYEESNNNANQNEGDSSITYVSNGPLATSYYSTLPNREAAETLATLAAAGSINSNLVNHIRNVEDQSSTPIRGDVSVEEDYAEEVKEDEEESEQSPPQINTSLNTFQRPKESKAPETVRFSSEHKQQHSIIRPHKTEEDVQEEAEYMDYSEDLELQGYKHDQGSVRDTDVEDKQHKEDVTPTNTNLQFGERIRPKRNK